MELPASALVVIALLLAGWTCAAALVMLRANATTRRIKATRSALTRMQHLLEVAPAVPLLVRVDGRIEAPEKLARLLGLAKVPSYLSELAADPADPASGGLAPDQMAQLSAKVQATQKSAAPFRLTLSPAGSGRALAMQGMLADPQVSPSGAALVWVFDFTDNQAELARLRAATQRAESDFAALVGLIEAAPVPMWFRGQDMRLQLVNQAYVDAVMASSASEVVAGQIELLEPENGQSPAKIARNALQQQAKCERIVAATIHGARRTLRVSDLPLGREGVAGYAIDIEEQQQVSRDFRAFREAQRAILDELSVGVAQFDAAEHLTFANRPFRRLFALSNDAVEASTSFERFLADARERGRTPEVRDFPEWRRERVQWFSSRAMQEEAWPLPGGTHLRLVVQPLPDGGIVMLAEDRTEQLALSAVRDTLLRTRTATLDSLFEALAIFAPDGSVQLWNRSFAGTWGLSSEFLDTHPSADELLGAIARNLAQPDEAALIGSVVRAATLDRREKGGLVELADGRALRFAGVPLPDGNGLLTVLDITDSQKAEKALRERAIALEEADGVKARFLANMSYEFRTPLTTIGGFAELLRSGVADDDTDQAREYLDAILAAVERLTEQVENVLDLSQSEAGLLPIAKERTDLLEFLTKLVREREQAIIASGLSLDLKGRRGRVIDIDLRQMGRALGNLIDNAIAGTPNGGRIVIELRKPIDPARWKAEVSIADNGRGMTAEELQQAKGRTNLGKDGVPQKRSGLGIPLARQLVEAHDGELDLVSRPGAGTTAIIRLP